MSNDPPILQFSALAAPFVALGTAALIDVDHALGTLVGSIVVLFNFWLLSVLGPRVVASVAREEPPTFWVIALLAKFMLLIGAFFVLFRFLPPFGLLLGFVPMVIGTLAAGVQAALIESAAEEG